MTFVLIAVPGPDWAFILGAGARDRVVVPAVSGLMIGYALLTLLVAAGVGAVVQHSPGFLTALTAVGAAYLVYLGISILRRPSVLPSPPTTDLVPGLPSRGGHVWRGVGVSALNPKGLLIFLAMLPQFTDVHGRWPTALQLAALGAVFVVTCGVFYTAVGFSAKRILNSRPAATRFMSRLSGAAMITVGVALVVEHIATRP
ncbi:MAG: LysE family translocator [Mycobacteriales bacterium]